MKYRRFYVTGDTHGAVSYTHLVADMDVILICTYEENGKNPELVLYKKR